MGLTKLSLDVLHVVEAAAGGIRRHVLDLVSGLQRLGVAQGVAYSPLRADDGFRDGIADLQARGVIAFSIPMHREVSVSQDLRASLAVRRLGMTCRPTVLHLHSSKAGGLGRLAAMGLSGARVVYTPNASAAVLSRKYAWIERVLGRLRTDCLIAVSQSEYEELANLDYVASRKLRRVDSGLSANEVQFAAQARPAVALPDGPTVMAAGRLSYQKHPEMLVDASAILLREFPKLRFVWIGDGELRTQVEERMQEHRVREQWIVTGWLKNPYPLIRRASVFATPSRYESFGYVVLEAMILGVPVVATKVTGLRDLVLDGDTGYLVDSGDVHGLAERIGRLLRDPLLAQRFREAGSQRAGDFGVERMVEQTLRLYRSVAGPARGTQRTGS